MAVIEVRDLRKRYRDTVALDGVGFTVEPGEIFGLVGPNGAGKTTAVEIVEGLRPYDDGTVRVLGLDVRADERQLRERVGVQLQSAELPERMRVGEALELYAGFYRDPRPVGELLEEWRLTDKARAQFRTLSGGRKQRLFLALALVGRPELVFFDEITTGLDPRARRASWDLVRRIRAAGVTVVLVILPTTLGTYRQVGVLRRLQASPVRPGVLLGAQLLVVGGATVVAALLVVAVGAIGFGVSLPRNPAGFVLAIGLGAAALLSLGLMIAAVAPSAKAANAIGMSAFFPSMFLGGVYVPRDTFPAVLQHVSDLTPLGAAIEAVRDTWQGAWPHPLHVVTMAAWALIAATVASRTFRWS